MRDLRISVLLFLSIILLSCVENNPTLADNQYLSCDITRPKSPYFNINQGFYVEVLVHDSIYGIDNVEIYIDQVILKTIIEITSPIQFYVEKNTLALGSHKFIVYATNKVGAKTVNYIDFSIYEDKSYHGDYTFTSKKYAYVILTKYLIDSIVYNGNIKFYEPEKIIVQFRENENIILKVAEDDSIVSEGDWYNDASKEGQFIGSDNVNIHFKDAGYRSSTHTFIEGKKIQ
jgi:hypothetical protein